MVDQVSLPTSYSNCSKKLEKSKHVHKMDRLSQKGQFKLNWRFLANVVLLLTHAEVFSPNRWVIVFSFNTIHSIITVHKCSSPSPGPAKSAHMAVKAWWWVDLRHGRLMSLKDPENLLYDFGLGRGRRNSKMCGSGGGTTRKAHYLAETSNLSFWGGGKHISCNS